MYVKVEGSPIRIEEVRTIKGHTYATIHDGNAMLVRTARQDYAEDGIARGDVYIEWLTNGSRESGARYPLDVAAARGFVFIDEPIFNYYGPERGFEPVEA